MRKIYIIPPECPECHTKVNRALAVGGATGHEVGEIMLCTHCGAINIFDEKISLKLATKKDLREFETAYPVFYQDLIFRQAMVRSSKDTQN